MKVDIGDPVSGGRTPGQTTLETQQLGIGDFTGDLVAGEWPRHWRLSRLGLETSPET